MDEASLHQFYQHILLPQFGFGKEGTYDWEKTANLGPDETAHWFARKGKRYILIYEDYDGLGRNRDFISKQLGLAAGQYEFVEPTSATDRAPSYPIKFPAPCMYARNITGTFTLLELN